MSRDSRVWFTLSHGILNEVYYPRVDHACTRDLGFIVTDGHTFFSEEKRDARSETLQVSPGIPAYRIRNTALDGRYRIEKEVLTDPWRDVVLQRVRFVPLQGTLADFRLYVLLAPHLANRGSGNTAWVGDYKGAPMLFAERDHHTAFRWTKRLSQSFWWISPLVTASSTAAGETRCGRWCGERRHFSRAMVP